jgi:Ca-activated chloride channel homolog
VYQRNRSIWQFSLFQIPLMLLGACLAAALLFWLLGLGKPKVSVAIALDLSNSTYNNATFNAPGTVLNQQVEAVRGYLDANAKLKSPNNVQVFGFGGAVIPLTPSFQSDSNQARTDLDKTLSDPSLGQRILASQTDVSLALKETQKALSKEPKSCKEVLLVTDGTGDKVDPSIIQTAKSEKTRLNVLIVAENIVGGLQSIELASAALQTGGIALPAQVGTLGTLFINEFFKQFNSNLKWIFFWLGLSWIALMWTLVLPMDRWFFQGIMGFQINLSGRLALGNALFWSVTTPQIIWNFARLPFISPCS